MNCIKLSFFVLIAGCLNTSQKITSNTNTDQNTKLDQIVDEYYNVLGQYVATNPQKKEDSDQVHDLKRAVELANHLPKSVFKEFLTTEDFKKFMIPESEKSLNLVSDHNVTASEANFSTDSNKSKNKAPDTVVTGILLTSSVLTGIITAGAVSAFYLGNGGRLCNLGKANIPSLGFSALTTALLIALLTTNNPSQEFTIAVSSTIIAVGAVNVARGLWIAQQFFPTSFDQIKFNRLRNQFLKDQAVTEKTFANKGQVALKYLPESYKEIFKGQNPDKLVTRKEAAQYLDEHYFNRLTNVEGIHDITIEDMKKGISDPYRAFRIGMTAVGFLVIGVGIAEIGMAGSQMSLVGNETENQEFFKKIKNYYVMMANMTTSHGPN